MSLYAGVEIPGHPDLENIRRLDLLAIPFIRHAQRIGMAIDPDYFHALSSEFSTEMGTLERDIASYIPPDRLHEFCDASQEESGDDENEQPRPASTLSFNAGSPEQIGRLLWEMLDLADGLKLKRTAAGKFSTGKKQLELAKARHPVVPLILRYRELRTLKQNYCDKLPRMARFHPRGACCPVCEFPHQTDQWRVHGEIGTTRADTGRCNHKNPNLGNIPTRTEDGQRVQAGFVAPPGTRLIARDLSQIELRDLAHLSNCQSMIDVYLADGDLHDDTCHRALGVPWDQKPDKIKHRMAAKRVNFGIQNGTTKKGLFLQLVMDFGTNKLPIPDWLTEDWCEKFIQDWLDSRPEVREWFHLQYYRARRYGMVWTPFGRVKLIPEVKSTHSWVRESGLRQAQNMPVTGLAADQLKLTMGRSADLLQQLADTGVWAHPIMCIHDANMAEVDEEYTDEAMELMQVAMDDVMRDQETGEHRFRVPIKSDGIVMERWEK